ncbi:MAG: DUF3857 domain-containing protein [Candidatus Acidiferrum sp.]
MPICRRALLASFLLYFHSARPVIADQPAAWSLPRFGPDAAALYQAASAPTPKPGTDVLFLDDEERYTFDADGKSIRTRYMVYKILTQRGAEGWDNLSLAWEPWHEERPELIARVITPDNAAHLLDPKTISDSPARDEDENTYGDSRVLRAPLPAIAPGSVVEELEVTKESAPFFGAGVVQRSFFGREVPVQFSKLLIDLPASLPIRYEIELLPQMRPVRTEANGRVILEFDQGPIEALDELEPHLPFEVPDSPQVVFATGTSWQGVAAGYAKIVDEKVALKDVQQLVNGLIANKTTAAEKTDAIVQYLGREIRYTGIEFGDAAIVPHTPAETLKRKYGDCKDKATLAVAMLRAAGVPAYVALLSVGRRQEVPADLPGMGLFDHAMVYVPGKPDSSPDLWIDATSEYSRLGQVPDSDQGRLALVARAETTALLRIPESTAKENLIVEKREFVLAESGPAKVVEVTEPSGVFESEYRSTYAAEDDKTLKKNFKDYVDSQYLAEKVSRIDMSKPADLAKQFQLTLEASGAKRGFTYLDSAIAAIRVETLFYWLPDELQEAAKPEMQADAKGDDVATEKPKKPRTEDYLLPEAFVCEWQYKIVPPLGFQARPIPPNASIPVGPALLTEEFSTDNDGTVRAVLRFDTVKRRYSASEAAELQKKIVQLRAEQAILIYFEPKAQALLNAGKSREAFEETRALIAQHPKEAVHHLQRAKMLLAAGMGQAARDEARAATKLDPTSVLAQKTLAEILEYDLVGRQYRRGSDYDGAEAAYRAAIKLDPDDKEIVGSLAILLEHNREGDRYGSGAKLPQAIAEYRSLKDEEVAKIGLQNNLAYALFYADRYAEAKKSAESVNPQLNSIIVASQTALHGLPAGQAEARKRTANDADYQTVSKSAGDLLMRMRRYPEAAELLAAGASGSNASATMGLAAILRKLRPHEQLPIENAPSGVVNKMFVLMMDPDITVDKLSVIYSRNAQRVIRASDPDGPESPVRSAHALRGSLHRTGYPPDVMLDVTIGIMQMQTEGDDAGGYRVTLTPPGSQKVILYIVKEDGAYRILDSAERPNSIGLEILDRVRAQNTSGARILLDWIRDVQHLPGGDDPLAGSAFPRLWSKGKDADATPDTVAETMKLAAAAMLAQSPETAGDAIPILEAARAKSSSDAEKLNIAIALLAAYDHVDDYDKLLALSAEVAKQYPESKTAFSHQQTALIGLRRFPEADQLALEMAKRLPDDVEIMRAYVRSAYAREDYKLAHERGEKIIADGKSEASDLNSVAWFALFFGAVQKSDLDDAIKGAQLSQNSAGVLHTLGCLYAAMGKTKEAREVLIQAMDQLQLDAPESDYWYAFGRIAEQYGELEIASADYNQVKKPKKTIYIPDSSFRLAQNRLTALHEQPAQKGQ